MESVCCFTFVLNTGLLKYAGRNSLNVNTGSVMGWCGNTFFHTKRFKVEKLIKKLRKLILINHKL